MFKINFIAWNWKFQHRIRNVWLLYFLFVISPCNLVILYYRDVNTPFWLTTPSWTWSAWLPPLPPPSSPPTPPLWRRRTRPSAGDRGTTSLTPGQIKHPSAFCNDTRDKLMSTPQIQISELPAVVFCNDKLVRKYLLRSDGRELS